MVQVVLEPGSPQMTVDTLPPLSNHYLLLIIVGGLIHPTEVNFPNNY